jgi:signal transduction histidine kinase
VEAAVYFTVAEAMANASRHSGAGHVDVQVTVLDGLLKVTVADDGSGGAAPARGTGLQGLADRLEALGGELRVTSPAGGGTKLEGILPCE